jgi:hypothetical protein
MIQELMIIQKKVDNLKDKIETEISFNDAPNEQKKEIIARDLKNTSKLKKLLQSKSNKIIENSDSGREFVLERLTLH